MSDDMTAEQLTAEELAESLTGYDEIAIAKAFGEDIYEMAPAKSMRALAFVAVRRTGGTDAEAKDAVMGMSIKDVKESFADAEDEVMPDEPSSESGKDGELAG